MNGRGNGKGQNNMYIRKFKRYELNEVIPFIDLKSSSLEGTRVDFDGDNK
jgi:hypothetical protein